MIGNPKWFSVRKYTGWGFVPNCWQGLVYIIVFVTPLIIIDSVSLNKDFKNIFTAIWVGIFLIDFIHIMSHLKKDERERLHEAIADRNALWFMIFALLIWAFIKQTFDPILICTIVGAMVVKSATHFYLRDK